MGRTFEEYFFDFITEKLQEAPGVMIADNSISLSISDRAQISQFVAEANFIVSATYQSKKQAGARLESVTKAIKAMPVEKPLVLRVDQLALDVDITGGPRKFIYTAVWAVRFHDEESY